MKRVAGKILASFNEEKETYMITMPTGSNQKIVKRINK
jgi:hypothetical protein